MQDLRHNSRATLLHYSSEIMSFKVKKMLLCGVMVVVEAVVLT